MVIDTHIHLIKPFDADGVPQSYSIDGKTGRPNPTSAEDYVSLMDSSGIDRAFFISWSPEDIPGDLIGKRIAPDSVRGVMNREYALWVMDRYGDRFYWFPCHLGPAIPDHLEMAGENLAAGAAGLKVLPSFWGELPDDERLLQIYELAEERGAQIILDTAFWYQGKDEPKDPSELLEGHRQAAARIKNWGDYANRLRRVFSAFPNVRFQLAHAGARTFSPDYAHDVGSLIRSFPNVYADLGALPLGDSALDILVHTAGSDRVMFGTDWPHFAQGERMTARLDAIRRPERFPPDVVDRILGMNALAFVGHREPGLGGRSA